MKSGAISRIRQGYDSCAALASLISILDPYVDVWIDPRQLACIGQYGPV
jgi:hypothetical protein